MTSQIDTTSIDATYPVAGQDNSSQGFRDNFTIIKSNFQSAYTEITALQTNAILSGQTNDLNGTTTITNGIFNGSRETLYSITGYTSPIAVNFTNGTYQKITLTGSTTVSSFSNWPSSASTVSRLRLEVVVNNTSWTMTWPSTVTLGYTTLANISSRTITFTNTGTYIFEISSTDGGTNFYLNDLSRNFDVVQGNLSLQTILSNAATTGISMTVQNVGGVVIGNVTATNFIGNIISTGAASQTYTGNVTANNIIANTSIVGTLATAIQSNITLVGTLSSLSVSGNANVGNLSVTGTTDMCGSVLYGIQYVTAANASSITLLSNVGAAIIDSNGTIGAYTITMPTTPSNGQRILLTFGNTITSLTHTVTGGQSLLGALTTAGNTLGGSWIYYATKSTWFRI